jgi:hypothetical protein
MHILTKTYPTVDSMVALLRWLADAEGTPEATTRFDDLVHQLRSNPRLATERLEQLSLWREPSIRNWVAAWSPLVLGREAMPLLDALMYDRDPTVQQTALASLLTLDREALRPHLERLRAKLHSFYNPRSPSGGLLQIVWSLLRMGDRESIPDLRRLAQRKDVPEWLRRNSEIAADYLERGSEPVVRRIRSHDHDTMAFSCRLAWRIGSQDVHAALIECSMAAPDEDCRQTCRKYADALEQAWRIHDPPYWDLKLP